MPINLDIASAYAGKPLFAVCAGDDDKYSIKERGKVPLSPQWQLSVPVSNLARFEGHEVGYALEDTTLILDVDVRDGKQGMQSLQQMSKDVGVNLYKLASIKVQTGSGGLHLYFRKPPEIDIKKTLRSKYPDIDFLSKGCFVVIAGSLHASGGRYNFIEKQPSPEDFKNLTDAPEAVLNILQKNTNYVEEHEILAPIKLSEDDSDRIAFAGERLKLFDPAVEGASGDATTYKAACMVRDLGLNEEENFQLMLELYNPRCAPPWSVSELRVKVHNAYAYANNKNPQATAAVLDSFGVVNAEFSETNFTHDPNEIGVHNWTSFLDMTKTREGLKMEKTARNCSLFLEYSPDMYDLLAFNTFTQSAAFTKNPVWSMQRGEISEDGVAITDSLILGLKKYFIDKYRLEFSRQIIEESCMMVSYGRQFHPVKNYLERIQWDGKDRTTNWLSDFCEIEGNQFTQAVGIRWLIGAIKRIYEPGCQMDNMLIFHGAQNAGKSSSAAIMAGPWFSQAVGDISGNNNQAEENIKGKWIIEVAELDGFKKADHTRIKDFVSRRVDRYRVKFDKFSSDFPRQSVFFGSTNESHFLVDTTGNRRFWTVTCNKKLDRDRLQANRDQLWAQAYHLYKAGHSHYLETDKLEGLAADAETRYMVTDPWKVAISRYLNDESPGLAPLNKVQLEDIVRSAIGRPVANMTIRDIQRALAIVRQLGWVEHKEIQDGLVVTYYLRT